MLTTVVIQVSAAFPNRDPVYTGPMTLEGEVGSTLQLTGTDADGDVITWAMEINPYADISPTGLVTFLSPGSVQVLVVLDDGR